MPTLTIKGIPDRLLAELRQAAAEQRRSLNGEVLYRLERSLAPGSATPEEQLARVDALRRRLALPALSDDELRAAIQGGRR